LNAIRPTTEVVRIHLPEWRDSLAVNQEIRRRLRAGLTDFLLTGARGDRLLLNAIDGPYEARIRIDGDVGTELARDFDADLIVVLVNGSAGSGAGMDMKSGTLYLRGPSGALLGTGMRGGEILAFGPIGSRAGHRATGGIIRMAAEPGPMVLDRSPGCRTAPMQDGDPATRHILTVVAAMATFGDV